MEHLGVLLLAMDGTSLRSAIAQSLGKLGWQVREADSVDAALAQLGSDGTSQPLADAVIAMPPFDAVTLLERCRLRAPAALRILANAPPDLAAPAMIETINRAAPYRYLPSPLDLWQLTRALQEGHAQRSQTADEQAAVLLRRRQRDLEAQLAREHADAVTRTDGSYAPTPTPRLADWEAARPVEIDQPEAEPRPLLDDALALLLRHPRQTISLVPRPPSYALQIVGDHGARTLAVVPASCGESLLRRLARLCALDLLSDRPSLQQLVVESGGLRARVLIALEPSGLGWRAELTRLIDWRELDELALLSSPRSHEYRFLQQVSETPLAIVYRALDITLERHTLVKMLRQPATIDPIAAARLLRQARAQGRITHAGIVQLLDYGSLPDGRPFVAHELIEWPTLRERLQRGRFSLEEGLPILRQLASTLAAAHEVDVVHRGLTPDCILLSDEAETKIGDFGFARLLNERGPKLTVAGQIHGDPYYLAPEQIGDGPIDGRTDLYALACIAWEMLTGSPPFVHADPWEVLGKHRSQPPPRLIVDGRPLWPELETELHSWLSKDATQRPDTSAAARTLETLLSARRGTSSLW